MELSLSEEHARKILDVAFRSSLAALGTNRGADKDDPKNKEDVERYFAALESSGSYGVEYVARCYVLLVELCRWQTDNDFVCISRVPEAFAAMLLHKTGYQPGLKGSDKESCKLFLEFYPGELTPIVFPLIRACYHNNRRRKTSWSGTGEEFFSDIALWMYGEEWESFEKWWGRILTDFKERGLPPRKFKLFAKRRLLKIWNRVRTGGDVYRTGYFRDKWEARARENVRRKLQELSPEDIL